VLVQVSYYVVYVLTNCYAATLGMIVL